MRSHLVNVYHCASNDFINTARIQRSPIIILVVPTIERISDQEGCTVQEMYVYKYKCDRA